MPPKMKKSSRKVFVPDNKNFLTESRTGVRTQGLDSGHSPVAIQTRNVERPVEEIVVESPLVVQTLPLLLV